MRPAIIGAAAGAVGSAAVVLPAGGPAAPLVLLGAVLGGAVADACSIALRGPSPLTRSLAALVGGAALALTTQGNAAFAVASGAVALALIHRQESWSSHAALGLSALAAILSVPHGLLVLAIVAFAKPPGIARALAIGAAAIGAVALGGLDDLLARSAFILTAAVLVLVVARRAERVTLGLAPARAVRSLALVTPGVAILLLIALDQSTMRLDRDDLAAAWGLAALAALAGLVIAATLHGVVLVLTTKNEARPLVLGALALAILATPFLGAAPLAALLPTASVAFAIGAASVIPSLRKA